MIKPAKIHVRNGVLMPVITCPPPLPPSSAGPGFVLYVCIIAGRERGKRLQKHNIIELSTLFLTNMCCHLVSLVE